MSLFNFNKCTTKSLCPPTMVETYMVKQYAQHVVEVMAKFCQDTFQLPNTYSGEWRVITKLSCSRRRRRSWAGWNWIRRAGEKEKEYLPFVNLSLRECRYLSAAKYNEYSEFAKDPDIGNFIGAWQKCCCALIAHEITHCVQVGLMRNIIQNRVSLASIPAMSSFAGTPENGHGEFFQYIYRIIRQNLVNGSEIPIPEPTYIPPRNPLVR